MVEDEDLHEGDEVEWNTSQGRTSGEVKKRITSETDIGGHTAKASEENPQYVIESDKSGNEAAHRPEALEKK